MPKKKSNLAPMIGVRLSKDDYKSVKRSVASGKYDNLSDAIRTLVGSHLTTQRLNQLGHDLSDKTIRQSQAKVIAPLKTQIDNVENQISNMNGVIDDLTKAVREYTNKVASSSQVENDLDFGQLHVKLDEILNLVKETLVNSAETKRNDFINRGILTFFSIGYQAGNIKPAKIMGEKKFFDILSKNAKYTFEKYQNDVNGDQEKYITEFAQQILNEIYGSTK